MEGYLLKYVNLIHKWQRRYCILDPNRALFYYFADKPCSKSAASPFSYLEQPTCESMQVSSSPPSNKISPPRRIFTLEDTFCGIENENQYVFSIFSGSEQIFFRATDQESMLQWVSAFECSILNANRNGNSQIKEDQISPDLKKTTGGAIITDYVQYSTTLKNIANKIYLLKYLIQKYDERYSEIDIMKLKEIDEQCEKCYSLYQILYYQDVDHLPKSQIKNNITLLGTKTENIDSFESPDNDIFSEPYNFTQKEVSDQNEIIGGKSQLDTIEEYEEEGEDLTTATETNLLNDSTDWQVYEKMYESINSSSPPDFNQGNATSKSILSHLLSQVRINMDLQKITLPTNILEPCSLLETFAKICSPVTHVCQAALTTSEEERLKCMTKFFISGLLTSQKNMQPKKPFNPILGEVFFCKYRSLPIKKDGSELGKCYEVDFFAEQVSHHPPVSAFCLKCDELNFNIDGSILTQSRFLGLSISCALIGEIRIRFANSPSNSPSRQYVATLPTLFARSIMTQPWLEFGDCFTLKACDYSHTSENAVVGHDGSGDFCRLEFKTKHLFSNKIHHVEGRIGTSKGTQLVLRGKWNKTIHEMHQNSPIKIKNGTENCENRVFLDESQICASIPIIRELRLQLANESRRLWKDVSLALVNNNLPQATHFKSILENKQRADANWRKSNKIDHQELMFLSKPLTKDSSASRKRWQFDFAHVHEFDQFLPPITN